MQSEALFMSCGICCVVPILCILSGFMLGKNWNRFKFQAPIVVDKPKQGESIRRDGIGYGKAKVK